jgi:hypothetical protein
VYSAVYTAQASILHNRAPPFPIGPVRRHRRRPVHRDVERLGTRSGEQIQQVVLAVRVEVRAPVERPAGVVEEGLPDFCSCFGALEVDGVERAADVGIDRGFIDLDHRPSIGRRTTRSQVVGVLLASTSSTLPATSSNASVAVPEGAGRPPKRTLRRIWPASLVEPAKLRYDAQ